MCPPHPLPPLLNHEHGREEAKKARSTFEIFRLAHSYNSLWDFLALLSTAAAVDTIFSLHSLTRTHTHSFRNTFLHGNSLTAPAYFRSRFLSLPLCLYLCHFHSLSGTVHVKWHCCRTNFIAHTICDYAAFFSLLLHHHAAASCMLFRCSFYPISLLVILMIMAHDPFIH